MSASSPIPPTSERTQPHWDAARDGKFVHERCDDCGHRPFPPRAHCSKCGSRALAWEAVSGRGRVHTFTVAHRAPHPKLAGQLPLVVAVVELEEGPRLVTNLVDCDPEKIEVGAAVEVRFEANDDSDVSLPVFTPFT